MATGTAGSSARQYTTAQTHYITTPFGAAVGTNSFGSTKILTTEAVKIGTIPSGAIVTACDIFMTVVYNAGSNNQVKFGTTSGGAELAALANGPATLGKTAYTLAASAALVMSADTDIYLNGGFTGTAVTTGTGIAVVAYYVPDSSLV